MTVEDRSLANLRPWQAGQSGNPAGRPKNQPLVTPALRRFAAMPAVEIVALLEDQTERDQLTVAEALALVILEKALKEKAWGDATRELVINRVDGPMKGAGSALLELEDPEGNKVRFSLNLGTDGSGDDND